MSSIRHLFAAALILPAFAFAQAPADTAPADAATPSATGPRVALTTNLGEIVIELEQDKAPKSVANFLQYVESGFYDGTVFHRVIENFMIQGGGFDSNLQQKQVRAPVQNEANNGLSNLRGTVAMARTNDPNSATSQFFINVVDNPRLNYVSDQNNYTWGYTVFGKVVKGMDVVDAIRAVETGAQGPFQKDVPKQPVIIEHAQRVALDADPAKSTSTKPASAKKPSGSND